ncbi:hypothetical protein GCM10009601_03430 [Streptomyces thermospinosisporus]|uniref:Uncharacterized protein n=1 Tax=Streptomyces thermospinosisporus TaxID=161482 RepID=A0ABN1YNB6_9ACTN
MGRARHPDALLTVTVAVRRRGGGSRSGQGDRGEGESEQRNATVRAHDGLREGQDAGRGQLPLRTAAPWWSPVRLSAMGRHHMARRLTVAVPNTCGVGSLVSPNV